VTDAERIAALEQQIAELRGALGALQERVDWLTGRVQGGHETLKMRLDMAERRAGR